MKFWIILFILFHTSLVHAQQARSHNYDVVTYGAEINRAELFITDSKFDIAFDIYDSIHNSSGLQFSKDYFNAALCLAYLNDAARLHKYLRFLVGMGVRTNWLKKDSAFRSAISTSAWRRLKRTEIKFYSAPNFLRDSLQSLFRGDQRYRVGYDAHNIHKEKIRIADSSNIAALNGIIKAYGGFPNEKQLGVHDSHRLVWQPYYIILVNQTPANKLYDYSTIILEEIAKGNIEPHIGSTLYTACSGDGRKFGSFELTKIVYTGNYSDSLIQTNRELVDSLQSRVDWRLPAYSIEVTERLNRGRRAFGMESIQDLQTKAVFLEKSGKSFIFFDFKKNIFLTSQKDFADSFLQNYQPLNRQLPY